jgi:hypothetical protein
VLIEGHATLVTTLVRSGATTVISMSGTLDRAAGAMAAAYLLDEVDVANGDVHLDLRTADLVDGTECSLVDVLRRRLAVRGHGLHLTTSAPADSGTLVIRPVPVVDQRLPPPRAGRPRTARHRGGRATTCDRQEP